MSQPLIVYFSSVSENTHKCMIKLNHQILRIPLKTRDISNDFIINQPYILCTPSYGQTKGSGSIPPQVIKFLHHPNNRKYLKGVIGAGNTNFGELYGIAADKISAKCHVPVLYKFELMGTPADIETMNKGVNEFWKNM